MSCVIWTKLLSRQGHFTLNDTNCILKRKLWNNMPLQEEMESLATDPIIWHGNGVGKEMFKHYGHAAFKCYLKNRNMTEQDHMNTFGRI